MQVYHVCDICMAHVAQDIYPLPGPSWQIIDCSVVLASFMCSEISVIKQNGNVPRTRTIFVAEYQHDQCILAHPLTAYDYPDTVGLWSVIHYCSCCYIWIICLKKYLYRTPGLYISLYCVYPHPKSLQVPALKCL